MTLSTPAHAAKWALLVGVNEYENPDITPLRYAVGDVKAVAQDLSSRVGFPSANVVVMTSDAQGNASPTNVNVLKRLDFLSRHVKPGDTFLFYFSGHGFIRGGDQHFLATVNADPQTIGTLQVTSLPMAVLRDQISRIHASSVVFIIDACRSDPEADKGGGDNKMTPDFKKDLKVVVASSNGGLAGTALLFACGEHERSYEEPAWKHGVFTHYLLEGLDTGRAADSRGELTMASLAQYVQGKVGAWSDDNDKEQHPDLEQQGAAQIVLADRFVAPATQVVIAPPVIVTPPVVVTPPVKPAKRQDPPKTDVDYFDNPPVAPAQPSGLAPIVPDAPDKAFGSAVLGLLDASSNLFQSYRGMIGTVELDKAGTWTVYTYRQGVPGFKPGMVRIHARADGNVYDAGNYITFEYGKSWPSADVDSATTTLRTYAGQVLAATGNSWSAKVMHPYGLDEVDIVCTPGVDMPKKVTVRLIKDHKSNYHLLLDVSDGMH